MTVSPRPDEGYPRTSRGRAWYVIRVQGAIDVGCSLMFQGFTITREPTGNSLLTGELIDEAAFYGLMSRARDLGLTILDVQRHEYPARDRQQREEG